MTTEDENGLPSPLVSLIAQTLSTVAGPEITAPPTEPRPDRLERQGWVGIGPVSADKVRQANAALRLLKAFDDGTAVQTAKGT